MKWLALGIAIVLGALSVYGWWFYFAVGPGHGPGIEIGIIAGQLALVALIAAAWLDSRGV
jgi:hypothetical protein